MKFSITKIISLIFIILFIIFSEINKYTYLNPFLILFSLGLLTLDEIKNKSFQNKMHLNKTKEKYRPLILLSIVFFLIFFLIFYYNSK
jgi:hypothetical protein